MDDIIHADCLDFMGSLEDNSIDLAILDPPYNVKAASWDDIPDYLNWMCKVLKETHRVLKSTGSLYLWGMSKNNDFLRLKLWIDENLDLEFRNWIVWVHEVKAHRRPKNKYLTKHEDLLFYSGSTNTFNMVRDDPPPFQLKMHKGRYDENYFIEREKLPPSMAAIFKTGLQLGSPAKSWWKGPSNQSNAKKYKKFSGYKSEWVCERIITVSSNENDVVLVPFVGTGTECFVAKKLNRKYLGCELDLDHWTLARGRLHPEVEGIITFIKWLTYESKEAAGIITFIKWLTQGILHNVK